MNSTGLLQTWIGTDASNVSVACSSKAMGHLTRRWESNVGFQHRLYAMSIDALTVVGFNRLTHCRMLRTLATISPPIAVTDLNASDVRLVVERFECCCNRLDPFGSNAATLTATLTVIGLGIE